MKHNSLTRRIIWWSLIAVFTFLLPSVIIIYRKLEGYFGQEATGKVPLYTVIIIGTAYTLYGFFKNRSLVHLLYLIPSVIIAYIIIRYEPNPNKHIHIPEYVLMAWLLYAALSKDYQGKGIFILIFICGSLLGVVDELEQGLHPRRFYGWSDMAVNSSSTVIGIFTILGLTKRAAANWEWKLYLKELRVLLGVILFGMVGAVFMCIQLFQVQANEEFWGIYPLWLLVWNIFFLTIALAMSILHIRKQAQNQTLSEERGDALRRTARLWIYPVLAILFFIHAIVVFVSVSGVSFR